MSGALRKLLKKLLRQHELFGHQRFLAQVDIGGLPFNKVAKNIELLATEVAPVVRRETKKRLLKEKTLAALDFLDLYVME